MIGVRDKRLWSAVLVGGLSALCVSLAWPTVRLALAAQKADAGAGRVALRDLTKISPVGPLAQDLLLSRFPPRDPKAGVEAYEALLSETPMASFAWLQLAIQRREAGLPMREVASALALSSLTGPNEAFVMAGRAAFGLPLWDLLPPDMRRGLVSDLLGGWEQVTDAQRRDLAATLTLSPPNNRSEIFAALALAGKSGEPIVEALDLTPAPAGSTEAPAGGVENR